MAHFISTKPEPAYHGGARGRREEAPAGQHYRLLKGANTQFLGQPRPSGQVVSAVGERKQEKKKTPYQFRPLDEIGAPRVRAGGKKKHDGNGYGLYPAAEKGDKRERGGGCKYIS